MDSRAEGSGKIYHSNLDLDDSSLDKKMEDELTLKHCNIEDLPDGSSKCIEDDIGGLGWLHDEDSNSGNDDDDKSDQKTPGSKSRDTETMSPCVKPKVALGSKSEVDMESALEQVLAKDGGNDLKKAAESEQYQLVVEKGGSKTEEEEDFCCICRDKHDNPKVLEKCSHKFCTPCIDTYFKIKPVCPQCFVAYGIIKGNQPNGYMHDKISNKVHLPGYTEFDTIIISYSFGDGIQTVS